MSSSGINSQYVDRTAGAIEYCESMKASHPLLAEPLSKIIAALHSKLWHQLTLEMLDLLQETNVDHLGLYESVIQKVRPKLAPLSVARMACRVAFMLPDVAASKAILENNLEEISVPQARVYLQAKYSLLTLQHLQEDETRKETLAGVAKRMAEQKAQVVSFQSIATPESALVASVHYESVMAYHKVVGPAEAFYEAALSFLQYAPVPATSPNPNNTTDYPALAMDLVLAALTGDGVYNLGQVQQETALLALLPPDQAWVKQLLDATAAGNVTLFHQLTKTFEKQIAGQPALVHRAAAVQEKLTLLSLVALVVSKEAHVRPHLQFEEIAQHLQVPLDQVEWVVMRAISVHLMEGTLDQVLQQVQVTWVLPRTLSSAEMKDYATRYEKWAAKTQNMATVMQQEIPTAFA